MITTDNMARLLVLDILAQGLDQDLAAIVEHPPKHVPEPPVLKNVFSLKDGPFTVVLRRKGHTIKVPGNYSKAKSMAQFRHMKGDIIKGYIQ